MQPASQFPESSQATTVLVLGILSLVCLPILGPVAWILGNQELRAIHEGRRDPANRGTANAGKILGIIGTVLILVVAVVVVLALLSVFIAGDQITDTFDWLET
jgi:ABC-type Fe3+ transport system permease subunit